MQLNIHTKVKGFYKIDAVKFDNRGKEISRRVLANWFPNLITNGGLNRMAIGTDWVSYCQVGSGNSTPAVTDTALVSRIGNNNSATVTGGVQSTSPYYVWKRIVYRFNEGVAAGNLSEVGVGWFTSGSLFSRALILDGLGSPTTITILSDETLDVTYEVRFYPKLTDDTGTVVATGNIGGTFDWLCRSARVGLDWTLNPSGTIVNVPKFQQSGSCSAYAGNGDIGAITGSPTGTSLGSTGLTPRTYVDNSNEELYDAFIGLSSWNNVNGIKCLYFSNLGPIFMQIKFTPVIMKTVNDILNFAIKVSWGRV